MIEGFFIVLFLTIFAVIVIAAGHFTWLGIAWLIRTIFFGGKKKRVPTQHCSNCGAEVYSKDSRCLNCSWQPDSRATAESSRDPLSTIGWWIQARRKEGRLSDESAKEILALVAEEHQKISDAGKPWVNPPTPQTTPITVPLAQNISPATNRPSNAIPGAVYSSANVNVNQREPEKEAAYQPVSDGLNTRKEEQEPPKQSRPEPILPKRAFAEVVAAFMEQSNIRWGEIIGGLLIIGCSTALVVSLWNEISQIPILKFLIFTTVTAAMFGLGLYSEHHWKLPTTSRGILTIATLLVPLNFLAIAAVSGGSRPSGAVVLASEIVAPILFSICVLYAGKVITPDWPGLLVAAVLSSSIGQLLVRHVIDTGSGHLTVLGIGLLPLIACAATVGFMIYLADRDGRVTGSEVSAIFMTLGAAVFSAMLPIGLLLFKAQNFSITITRIAPVIAMAGLPLMATGLYLWKRIDDRKLSISQNAGTTIAIIGGLICFGAILVSWPSPLSMVLAAAISFAAFSIAAEFFDLGAAHFIGAISLSIAGLVGIQVAAGRLELLWSESSLKSVLSTPRSAQSLAVLFVLLIAGSELLRGRSKGRTGQVCYLIVAAIVAAFSTTLISAYGFGIAGDPFFASIIYAIYCAGAFWVAWRLNQRGIGWIASAFLFVTTAQMLGALLSVEFPWQAAALLHATICAVAALYNTIKPDEQFNRLARTLKLTGIVTSFASVLMLLQAARWEPTSLQASRIFWLAIVWLLIALAIRSRFIFNCAQAAVNSGVMLSVKSVLLGADWYVSRPHSTLNPWSIQIHGFALAVLGLAWVGIRKLLKVYRLRQSLKTDVRGPGQIIPETLAEFLDVQRITFDRIFTLCLAALLMLYSTYAALPGAINELRLRGSSAIPLDLAGFTHVNSLAVGSWIVVALLLLLMLCTLWQTGRRRFLVAAVAVAYCYVPLLSAWNELSNSTASTWRWLAIIFLALAMLPLWFRKPFRAFLDGAGSSLNHPFDSRLVSPYLATALTLAITPVAVFSAFAVLRALYYLPPVGPAGGLFLAVGNVFSYTIPIAILGIILVANARSESSPRFGFAGALTFNAAITVAFLLAVMTAGGEMNRVVSALTIQYNAITLAICGLVWIAVRRPSIDVEDLDQESRLIRLILGMAVVLTGILVGAVGLRLLVRPELAGIGTAAAGGIRGWIGFVLTTIAGFWFVIAYGRKISAKPIVGTLVGVASLVSFDLAQSGGAPRTGLYALTISITLAGFLMLLVTAVADRLGTVKVGPLSLETGRSILKHLQVDFRWSAIRWTSLVGLAVTLIGLRCLGDESGYWYSVAALASTALLMIGQQYLTHRRRYLYCAGLLLNLAASIWWISIYETIDRGVVSTFDFLYLNIAVLGLPVVLWAWLELRTQRGSQDADAHKVVPSVHRPAAILALVSFAFLVLVSVLADLNASFTYRDHGFWGVLALIGVLAALVSNLYDKQSRIGISAIFILGMFAVVLLSGYPHLEPQNRLLFATIGVALYTLGGAFAWSRRRRFDGFRLRVRMPGPAERMPDAIQVRWPATIAVVCLVLASWTIVLSYSPYWMRLVAGAVVALQFLTFVFFAENDWEQESQMTGLAMLSIGVNFCLWAWLTPGVNGTWLNRAVLTMIAVLTLIAGGGLIGRRLRGVYESWIGPIKRVTVILGIIGGSALLFVLSTELYYQRAFGAVHINWVSLVTVALTLIGAACVAIAFALNEKLDPLKLTERGRMRYVYLAEIFVALLFMHIRLTMPWLFTGFFQQYWPIVVVGIAFAGVGISEVLRRQGISVIAAPLERTGAFLPLLPVLGFWAANSRVEYSTLLFSVGVLYAALSIMRRSFGFGVLAALAGNGGLWNMFYHTQTLGFLQHPQLWLIPFALSALVSAQINRDRLDPQYLTSVRYVSLILIYISSTADIFISGVAESPWLPIVLAGLSLGGVFLGISLRVRAFLYLGSMFLLVAVVTMIWYASANLGWTWLWYVAGIMAGSLIIFTFALFEKKRSEMVRMVEGLREWQS